MRRFLAPLAVLAVLAGCGTTPTTEVAPGDGPAAPATSQSAEAGDGPGGVEEAKAALCSAYTPDDAEWVQYDCAALEGGGAPEESQPSDEPTEEPSEETSEGETATFTEKYTYEDGVEVEVTKINRGKVSNADAEYAEPEASAGDPYVQFTVRTKNGSSERLDAYGSFTVTYGPDGEEATSPYLSSVEETDLTGKILPKKAKVATDTFVIPTKYQDDVVLEFNFDFEHESAIFAGSVK
ncbi:hypothetical protein GCM10009616_35560 [Microlunatus lacustris]